MKCQGDISYVQFCFEIWRDIWKIKHRKRQNLNWSKNAQYSKSGSNLNNISLLWPTQKSEKHLKSGRLDTSCFYYLWQRTDTSRSPVALRHRFRDIGRNPKKYRNRKNPSGSLTPRTSSNSCRSLRYGQKCQKIQKTRKLIIFRTFPKIHPFW